MVRFKSIRVTGLFLDEYISNVRSDMSPDRSVLISDLGLVTTKNGLYNYGISDGKGQHSDVIFISTTELATKKDCWFFTRR